MFVWVPRECFMFGTFDFEMPALMRMPAYDKKSYAEGDAWSKDDDPSTWIGEPVIADKRVGVLGSLKKDWAMVVSFEPYSRGSFGVKPAELRRAIPKKPNGPKLSYVQILREAAMTVSGVDKDGATIELSIRVPPDGRALPFRTETDAFETLYAPLVIKSGIVHEFRPSALSDALVADLAEREMEGAHRMRDVRAELARKYVRSFTLVPVAPYSAVSLDMMSEKDAHDVLAGPWPTAKLRIVATDPKWIAHLDLRSYDKLALEAHPLDAPRDPAPKAEPAPIVRPDARAVLWFGKGTSDKIWMIERFGNTLKTRYGRRGDKKRTEKNEVLGSDAAAIKSFDKAVAKKTKEGYAAPFTTDEAVAAIAKALGVVVTEDASGALVVTSARHGGLRAKDRIESFRGPDGEVHLHVVEELAITTIDVPKGTDVYLAYHRPATGVYTSASIKVA